MRWNNSWILWVLLASVPAVQAQRTYDSLGRAATPEEIQGATPIVGPSGVGLPPGSGTAKQGAELYTGKCRLCHGPSGEGIRRMGPRLVGGEMHPFATTIWNMINGSMPRNVPHVGRREGTLTSDEVYSLVAFILYKQEIIKETDVVDAQSLPRVRMPIRDPRMDSWAPR
ncbi:MAG: c-type cytochrome [Terriglobia bacterium]